MRVAIGPPRARSRRSTAVPAACEECRVDAVVVDPQHRDHVIDVRLGFDPARRRALAVGKHGVVLDPALGVKLAPELLGEEEVGTAVAVQVADLTAADAEPVLAALAEA